MAKLVITAFLKAISDLETILGHESDKLLIGLLKIK